MNLYVRCERQTQTRRKWKTIQQKHYHITKHERSINLFPPSLLLPQRWAVVGAALSLQPPLGAHRFLPSLNIWTIKTHSNGVRWAVCSELFIQYYTQYILHIVVSLFFYSTLQKNFRSYLEGAFELMLYFVHGNGRAPFIWFFFWVLYVSILELVDSWQPYRLSIKVIIREVSCCFSLWTADI